MKHPSFLFIWVLWLCSVSSFAQSYNYDALSDSTKSTGLRLDSLYQIGQAEVAYPLAQSYLQNLQPDNYTDLAYLHIKAALMVMNVESSLGLRHLEQARQISIEHIDEIDSTIALYALIESSVIRGIVDPYEDTTQQWFDRTFDLIDQYERQDDYYAFLKFHEIKHLIKDRLAKRKAYTSLLAKQEDGLPIPPFILLNLHGFLGSLHLEESNYSMGNQYFDKALSVINTFEDSIGVLDIAGISNRIAENLLRQSMCDRAKPFYNVARVKIEESGSTHTMLYADILSSEARCLISEGHPERALHLIDSALFIAETNYKHNVRSIIAFLRIKIQMMNAINETCDLEVDAASTIARLESYNNEYVPPYFKQYLIRDLAYSYKVHEMYDRSWPYFKAYFEMVPIQNSGDLADILHMGSLAHLSAELGYYNICDSIIHLLEPYLNSTTVNVRHLNFSLNLFVSYQLMLQDRPADKLLMARRDSLIPFIRQILIRSTENASQQHASHSWVEDFYYCSSTLLEWDAQSPFLTDEQYYFFIENIRGAELQLEHFFRSKWNNEYVNAEMIDLRSRLKSEAINIRSSLSLSNVSKSDSLEMRTLLLDDSVRNIESLIKSDFPPLESLLPGKHSIDDLQQSLKDDQLLIEYFFGCPYISALVVSKSTVHRFAIEHSELVPALDECLNTLQSDDYALCDEISKRLYQMLLRQALDSIEQDISSLIIVADKDLHKLPFELLCDENRELLVEHMAVTYEPSVQLMINRLPMTNNSSRLLAYAPKYDEIFDPSAAGFASVDHILTRDEFYFLPGAIEEAKQVADLWNGRALIGSQASKSEFLQLNNKAGILHLAMHAIFDDKDYYNSRLIFGQGASQELRLAEIGQLNLDTDLVTLSACNTGNGPAFRGKGTKSLAGGFLTAGARSVMLSLWRAPDESTSKIMSEFYKNMLTGLSKDKALQQAKKTWLSQVEHPRQAHPMYWAGFQVYGDTSPLKPAQNRLWWVIFGVLVSVGIVLLLRKQRSMSK